MSSSIVKLSKDQWKVDEGERGTYPLTSDKVYSIQSGERVQLRPSKLKVQIMRPLKNCEGTQISGIDFTCQCIAMKLNTAQVNLILSRVDYSPWTIHDTGG